jgi:metallo-beta-lactamase family protein
MMNVSVTFLGAVRTTTGSTHLVDTGKMRILLDCGLFQGKRKEAFEKNRNFSFEPSSIDMVVLSHAHMDHAGNLPTLVKAGFRGKIMATPPTIELCDIMLRDSAHLQVKDVEHVNKRRARQGKALFEPLYKPEDVDEVISRFVSVEYEKEVTIGEGITLCFHDAGHLLGSATVELNLKSNGKTGRLLFTGDLGRNGTPILRNPVTVSGIDFLITEATYGNRIHPPKADAIGRLKGFIEDIVMQKSRLIIPSFSVGRTQEVLYYLHELYTAGRIPAVPVFVDSPLSNAATMVYDHHPDYYNADTVSMVMKNDSPFYFKAINYVESVEDSKKLNSMSGPAIIISASGMCEGGRILHHLANNISDPRNIILFVGYQAENTLGRKLVEHADTVKIFGESYPVLARVHTINAFSAHADRNELLEFIMGCGKQIKQIFIVHGELTEIEPFGALLREHGFSNVTIPVEGERFTLNFD